jgi:hypothetical protein
MPEIAVWIKPRYEPAEVLQAIWIPLAAPHPGVARRWRFFESFIITACSPLIGSRARWPDGSRLRTAPD